MHYLKFSSLILLALIFNSILYAQCPADLTVTNGLTGTWTNTTSMMATVSITAVGAGGGKNTTTSCLNPTTSELGGSGATVIGTFLVGPGNSLFAISGEPGFSSGCSGGGGGASGVVNCGNPLNCGTGAILLVAGGGAGTSGYGIGPGGNVSNGSGNGGGSSIPGGCGGGGLNSMGAGYLAATGGGMIDKTAISLGGVGVNTGGNGGNGFGAGGAGFAGYAGGGGGNSGGNGESDIATAGGGFSINNGITQSNIAGIAGGGANVGSVTIQCLSTVLPVQIISFTGRNDQRNNILEWQTSSEVSNAYFEIQRSIDGIHFESLGDVVGEGNSSIIKNYSFVDDRFVANTNYYRLKQFDIDNKFQYSKVATITSHKTNAISIFPNPGKESTTISVTREFLNSQVNLVTIEGRVIRSFTLDNEEQSIDISTLAMGVYSLQFKDGTAVKLIKE